MTEEARRQLRDVKGVVHNTESFGAVDGPGIRYVFFLQGCPMRCLYCHNPDAMPCRGGTVWTAGQALDEALRYRRYIQSGGVTFSGGEPLLQPQFVAAAAALMSEAGIASAIDTSGSEDPARPEIRAAIDAGGLLLLDIKALDPQMAKRITGRDNKNALATLDYAEETGKPVWVRHVLLPGYTLDDDALEKLAQYLKPYRCVERVELLPFHKLGEHKWREMGWEYTLEDTPAVTQDELRHAQAIFARAGVRAQ